MRYSSIVLAALAVTVPNFLPGFAQSVKDPHASIVNVAARQAMLKATTDPFLVAEIKSLPSCVNSPAVAAPTGVMDIPHHYLSGSNGPVNPAEAVATRIYADFERRITAGMNQYLATSNHAESACALAQLDDWAKARALLNYDRKDSSQAWFQVEWTLSSAGITDSVLVNDTTLDPAQQKRVTAWLDTAAHKDISFEQPNDTNNNHHYWRALAATAIGITASDDVLYRFGIQTYVEAITEIDPRGAFPKEMARHENAIHYQGFALQPLVLIAELVTRQGVPIYGYKANGHTLRDAIVFFARAADDPSLVKPYTSDEQATHWGAGDFADFAFYVARFGPDNLPSDILEALKRPSFSTRIGGSTALLAGESYTN
jgi:poly(beta-D-mannuronate) lyase